MSAGFSLIGLLVVVGIIATRIAILLPALSRARAQSRALVCHSQLRKIGTAVVMYASANRVYFP